MVLEPKVVKMKGVVPSSLIFFDCFAFIVFFRLFDNSRVQAPMDESCKCLQRELSKSHFCSDIPHVFLQKDLFFVNGK